MSPPISPPPTMGSGALGHLLVCPSARGGGAPEATVRTFWDGGSPLSIHPTPGPSGGFPRGPTHPSPSLSRAASPLPWAVRANSPCLLHPAPPPQPPLSPWSTDLPPVSHLPPLLCPALLGGVRIQGPGPQGWVGPQPPTHGDPGPHLKGPLANTVACRVHPWFIAPPHLPEPGGNGTREPPRALGVCGGRGGLHLDSPFCCRVDSGAGARLGGPWASQ